MQSVARTTDKFFPSLLDHIFLGVYMVHSESVGNSA